MGISITNLLVNNVDADPLNPVSVRFTAPIVSWRIETTKISIHQSSFEVRIGRHTINWGTDNYQPDVRKVVSQSEIKQFKLDNKFINRGETYYGQLRVLDSAGSYSDWFTFSFKVNRLSFVTSAAITPAAPSETDDLILSYALSNANAGVRIKWFRNGINYRQFDNFSKISREYLRYKDVWSAEITPYDSLENGPTFPVNAVTIQKLPPVASSLEILPKNANNNDILEASYSIKDQTTNNILLDDKSKIRWFVNNILIEEANDYRFVRFQLKPDDEVHFTVTPSDGQFDGDAISSSLVTIVDSGFRLSSLKVDGLEGNINIKSVNPTVEWTVIEPYNRVSRFAKIQIGSVPGAANVYETVIETFDEQFTIPDNLIKRGVDYYVTVWASDTSDVFENPRTSHFRVAGSLWEREVSNSTGWAMEVATMVEGEGYQRLSIGDGKRFAEIRFYETKIDVLFGGSNILSYDIDMTTYQNIIISAQNDTLKLFIANALAIDGTDQFTQLTSERFIEVGTRADSECIGFIKRLAYSVTGFFDPSSSNEYSNITVQPFITFVGSSVSSIADHEGDILVATNPRNPDTSAKIFRLLETKQPLLAATENIDNFDLKINSISGSPDEIFTWFPHSRGASYFKNYAIPLYDINSQFLGGYTPALDNWQLVTTTPFEAASYRPDGLVIDTTFDNTARIDSRLAYTTLNIPAIELRYLWSEALFQLQPVTVSEDATTLTIDSSGPLGSDTLIITKAGKTVQQICNIINAHEGGFIRYLISATPINDTEDQAASNLTETLAAVEVFPYYNLKGNYRAIDPYNPNPYSYSAGGKWFYTHRRPGNPWFDECNPFRGYTVDLHMAVESVEDVDRPSNTDRPEGSGLYINDGAYYETIYFLPQEIVFGNAKQSFIYDTSTLNRYRLTGKNGVLRLWGKKPSEADYTKIGDVNLTSAATRAGNAGRPAICSDASGHMFAAWHDDGNNGKRQIYFAEFVPGSGWSEAELIVSDSFGANNPDIAIDSLGIIYVVFETQQSDRTDIAIMHKNELGWSEPYMLTSNVGDSLRPRIAIDIRNNVHVVWEDHRLNEPEIFYCRRNSANGQWNSSAFGGEDVRISDSPEGAKYPCITATGTNYYIAWTAFRQEGTSQINVAYGSSSNLNFSSSAKGGTDFLVSTLAGERAGFPDLMVDMRGRILCVWHDLVDHNYQIFGRFLNARLVSAGPPVQLTTGIFDARFPKISVDMSSGDLYVVFEKEQDEFIDPYDPYSNGQTTSKSDPAIYLNRYNAGQQFWESSNVVTERNNIIYGGFDVRIDPGDARISRRPAVPDRFYDSALHIVYETLLVASSGENLPNEDMFRQIRDAVYDTTFENVYTLHDLPYVENDVNLSNGRLRKEIRFGDFSDTLGCRQVINTIRYYCHDAVDPFAIRLVSSATTNMPSGTINCTTSNNSGDAWFGTDNGLLFFSRSANEVFVLDSENFGVAGLKVKDITIDNFGNMWLATDQGVYFSPDHAYFWKITNISSATSIAVDFRNNIYIGTAEGLYVFDSDKAVAGLKVTTENYATPSSRTITVEDITLYNTTNGMPSSIVNVVRTDANNVAWVGTNKGLVRFADGAIAVFNMNNGMSSNKVNDITIRNTGIRYVATTAGVDKMVGVSIERLDFDNINAPVSAETPIDTGDIKIPRFNNIRSVLWKEPNILFVAAGHDIYQIVFTDDHFTTHRTQISNFSAADYALIPVVPERNDDLQTYKLVGVEDISLPETSIFEVFLNGNPITRGFAFSPTNQVLRFAYPLLKSDIIQVNVRPDIELVNDFRQDKAAQLADGNQVTLVEKIVTANGGIYAQTGGDINTIQINDQESDKPFDRIVLDATPPIGKIKIEDQIDQTHVLVSINKILSGEEYLPFDATSGIDKMIISNYTNFTDDGEVAEIPVPFATSAIHDLGVIFDHVTRQFTFPDGDGRRLMMYIIGGDGSSLITSMKAGTSSPASVFSFNSTTQLWERTAYLGEEDNTDAVNFMIQYNGKLVVGTGQTTSLGKIFVSEDGINFGSPLFVDGDHAYCAAELDGMLYIGTGGGSEGGQVYRFDGLNFEVAFSHISGAVFGLVAAHGELYASTGSEGRVYRLDPKNSTQQIVHVDYESNLISIGTGSVNDNDYVFVGGATNATIKRSLLPDKAFIHSFKTISAPVYSIKAIDGLVYAAIGNTLFVLDGVWTAKYTHSQAIQDVSIGPGNTVWFVSEGYVYRIEDTSILRNVYLKLIDRAGNETKLFTDEAQTVLDPNLYDSIGLEQLVGFTNSNRILEVNEFGDTVYRIDGDDKFYSADKIDEEVGVYYTEIFNGTNGLVSWDKISWDATIPANTSLKFFIRTGPSRDDVLDAEFLSEFDGAEQRSADISYLSGQHLQVKIVMASRVRGVSPSLRRLTVKSISGESVHFFTTNFVLPSRVKSGLITSHSKPFIPISADVIFGVNANNSVDFSDYQIIDQNRVFTTDDRQIGSNLRVGIRLITPTKGESISEEFGEYGPYSSPLFFNSASWSYKNTSGSENLFNFIITFYEDINMTSEVFSASSEDSVSGFSFNGDVFSSTGALMDIGETGAFSYTPPTDAPLVCNTFYHVKIEVIDPSDNVSLVNDSHSFVQACGVTYVDMIDFNFTNESATNNFHFRIRFYDDQARTNLIYTAFSGNDLVGWAVEDEAIVSEGHLITGGQTVVVSFEPNLTRFQPNTIYYLSIDAFDGEQFVLNSNSFTFKARDFASGIYCGEYSDVPVVKNFGLIFELEGGQMVTLQLEG